ncbi:hypothetical protein [Flindersiella endophytica]
MSRVERLLNEACQRGPEQACPLLVFDTVDTNRDKLVALAHADVDHRANAISAYSDRRPERISHEASGKHHHEDSHAESAGHDLDELTVTTVLDDDVGDELLALQATRRVKVVERTF